MIRSNDYGHVTGTPGVEDKTAQVIAPTSPAPTLMAAPGVCPPDPAGWHVELTDPYIHGQLWFCGVPWDPSMGGGGSVTSVTLDPSTTGLTVNGGTTPVTITTAGTFTLGGTLATSNGGTGTTAAPNTAGGMAKIGMGGFLEPAYGGTGSSTSLTQGSVVFAGVGGAYSQDNANFFWNDANNQLIIGSNALVTNPANIQLVVAKDALINGATVGRGGSVGFGGIYNTALGYNALAKPGSGFFTSSESVAVGYNALRDSTANGDVAVGFLALSAAGYNGGNNVAVGWHAMELTTGGYSSVGVGFNALKSMTTGGSNVAVGGQCMISVDTGLQNAALGSYTMNQLTSGNDNVAIGTNALQSLITGSNNVAIGVNAAYDPLIFVSNAMSNYVVLGNNSTQFLYCKTSTISTSDVRDKVVYGEVLHGLDFVNKINPIAYRFKENRESDKPQENEPLRYGFSAQEILALEGETNAIVIDSDPEHLAINGAHLIPVLVNAIKELSAKNDELAAAVEALKTR